MKDPELMAMADGEHEDRELEDRVSRDPAARRKVEALGELGELVRGHLELTADAVPRKKFDALWREIDKGIDRSVETPARAPAPESAGWLRRVGRWFDHYRSHIITAAVSAGAVGALALVLRGHDVTTAKAPVENMPVIEPADIEELDTPGGTGTVFNLNDEDGSATVIWVTPEDTVEGI